jgi:signal transduction histidine kinase
MVVPETIPAARLLKSIALLMERHEVAESRQVLVEPVDPSLSPHTDPTLIHRILVNLTKNALEASPKGEQVSLGAEAWAGGVRFWVKNQAMMPKQVRLQIFQRSFSTKGAGRGLGTYSVKLITERYLQGQVSFTSTPEEGTIFYVDLPAAL